MTSCVAFRKTADILENTSSLDKLHTKAIVHEYVYTIGAVYKLDILGDFFYLPLDPVAERKCTGLMSCRLYKIWGKLRKSNKEEEQNKI